MDSRCGDARTQLNAVLDGLHTNGTHNGNSNDSDSSMNDEQILADDARIKKQAEEQDQSRRRFDQILSRPTSEWLNTTDPSILSDALITVLHHIRGEDISHTRPSVLGSSVAAHTTGNGPNPTSSPLVGSKEAETVVDSEAFGHPSPNGRDETPPKNGGHFIASRAKYIPMRLTSDERKLLRLVEAALNVSEYTDVVDVVASRTKTKNRIHVQLRDLCSILTGLAVANDYSVGQRLVADRDFAQNKEFFQHAFEVARRHKVANPEKSRDTYGKLIHLLQDSAQIDIKNLIGFSCVKPMLTVAAFLKERDGLALLDDPIIETATRTIIPDGKSRRQIQREILEKEHAVKVLAKRYRNKSTLTDDDVRLCLYSIGDNNAYLRSARDPCDTMIDYLHYYFSPDKPGQKQRSLAIATGVGGARLTHDHTRQFRYVHQSLALWREVCHEMYKLWYLSETDLLDSNNPYVLRDTGQGMNRVQSAPNVHRAMLEILGTVQHRVGQWVGSAVIHLGDYNVPNALIFIDKYAQIQRILGPLCTCILRLGDITKDKEIAQYVDKKFGGLEESRALILRDFFRHAFDGSGANDWFSAGSCIDGRLTSAWNWCSDVEKKPFWPLMLLTGFTGFDGEF